MVIDMNTLIAAFNFGNQIAKVSTLHQKYNYIKSKLSLETWLLYQDVINTCPFSHYNSFELAYRKIEAVCSSKDGFYQECFIELRDCSEVHLLIKEGNQLGRDLENSLLQMLVGLPSRDIYINLKSLDLYRAWMNVFYHLHSTKLFTYLHQHKANVESKQSNVKQFLESKEIYPFSRNNRLLIRKLDIKGIDKEIMYFLEFFDGLRNSVLQIIFESHFNRSLKLNKNEIVDYREKERNKFRVFSTKVLGTEVFRHKGNFILLFENNIVHEIGLIRRRMGRNLEMGDKSISTIEGLLYPKNDYNLFVPNLPY
ncbi:hypothetical protein COL24_00940 [Bacillus toyonensis]|uniref:hypothetical protein n=1 Tax=Bacillus toyonensis TaxID=155322 RepID=UPI000BEFF93D|nr:hypothetical protein [Bacillus toyonensis]PEO24945.1 hypothetical protein CN589_26155 [Bacillus toyonensis]PFX45606.1 hypothetical protein COL24_00940 [Bacillus toyonensis]PFX97227.1 hypothetical protein COL45_28405 [Bacillus toyonensis]PHB76839.1 hypothetical protein COE93_16875 [Bacillus toyonensis]